MRKNKLAKVEPISKETIMKDYAKALLEINTKFAKLTADIDKQYNDSIAIINKNKLEFIKKAQNILKRNIASLGGRKEVAISTEIPQTSLEEKKDV